MAIGMMEENTPNECQNPTLLTPKNNDSQPTASFSTSENENIKSQTRRQLLFSLLAAAAASSAGPRPAFADASSATSSSTLALAAAVAAAETAATIIKSPRDDREYLSLVLPSNGLRVLLCSDPSTNEAAAAMDVHVGACSDPTDLPGLAHFHEHMLFLGTKDYPQEDSFESFLANHGGSSNAFTDTQDTVYYYDIQADDDKVMEEGLDRFASFFTCPLFTESATGRELNAIENENSKNLQSDSFRIYQIEKSRANPNHPYSKFFTGNKKTLLEDAKNKNIDVRQQLLEFNQRYYSSNQMTLAVVGPQSISTLQQYVETSFGKIPNRNTTSPELAWAGTPPFLAPPKQIQQAAYNSNNNDATTQSIIPSFQNIVEIVPVQELRQVTIIWPRVYRGAPQTERNVSLLDKPADYVSHLIGHEGPGSLLSHLKRQNWANSLSASSDAEFADFETFTVTVELTTRGLEYVDRVVERVFSYIRMLSETSIPPYIFTEVLQMNELEWRFLTKTAPSSYVTSLATAMQLYPPSLTIAGPRRLALLSDVTDEPRMKFANPSDIQSTRRSAREIIDTLKVDNAIVTVLSKTFAKKTDKKEKWYGTNYRVRPISDIVRDKWKNPAPAQEYNMFYPKPNIFIPSQEGLRVKNPPPPSSSSEKKLSFEQRMRPIRSPTILRDDNRWTVHFKQDDRFGQPKAFVVFQLLTSNAYSSAQAAVLGQLYQQCATDALEEYAYDARLAGLTFDLQVLPRGVRLTYAGYNDKLQEFASYVTQRLVSILPRNEIEFERYRDNLMRGLAAFDVKQPYAHASYYSYISLVPRRVQYTNADLRRAAEEVSRQDLVQYVETLWSSGRGQALVQGNLNQNEANRLVETVDEALKFVSVDETSVPPRTEALPLYSGKGKTQIVLSEPNSSNPNSAVHVVLQSLGRTEKDHVLIEILESIVNEPFYGDLRTKQQLGYIVSSGIRAVEETRTIAFVVQSGSQSVEKLASAIFTFLDGLEAKLEALSEANVAVYVKGLVEKKTEPDKQLAVEVTRNWNEISSGRFQFDRLTREATALLDIQKSDLLDFWRRIYRDNDSRRILMTQVIPQNGPASTSRAPPSSTGFDFTTMQTNKNNNNSKSIKLGVNDVQSFREAREPAART